MDPVRSLPHSQVPATCSYPEPARSSPYPHIPLPDDPFNIVLPSTPGSSKCFFPSDLLTIVRHLSLSWTNSIQSIPPTSHFLKIHLIIILPSTPGSPKWSLSHKFPHQNPVFTSPLPHSLYIPRPSNSRFYHPKDTEWGVQNFYMIQSNLNWIMCIILLVIMH